MAHLHSPVAAVPLVFVFLMLPASSQTFEVASLKPAAPYRGGPIHIAATGGPDTDDPTHLTFSNATLTLVLQRAFDLLDTQKIDGPEWLNIDMFDIAATLPRSATKDRMRVMLLVFSKCDTRSNRTWREHVFVHAPSEASLIRKAQAVWNGMQTG